MEIERNISLTKFDNSLSTLYFYKLFLFNLFFNRTHRQRRERYCKHLSYNPRARVQFTPLRVNLFAKLNKCERWNRLVTSNRIPSAYEEQADSYTSMRLQSTRKKSGGEVSGEWNRSPTFLRLPIHSLPSQSWNHHSFEPWIIAKSATELARFRTTIQWHLDK